MILYLIYLVKIGVKKVNMRVQMQMRFYSLTDLSERFALPGSKKKTELINRLTKQANWPANQKSEKEYKCIWTKKNEGNVNGRIKHEDHI